MDAHLAELIRQCADATPLGRLATVEQEAVFAWLIRGGHIERTGKALERPRQPPHPIAQTTDGQPIYAADADHSSIEIVTMDKAPRR